MLNVDRLRRDAASPKIGQKRFATSFARAVKVELLVFKDIKCVIVSGFIQGLDQTDKELPVKDSDLCYWRGSNCFGNGVCKRGYRFSYLRITPAAQ